MTTEQDSDERTEQEALDQRAASEFSKQFLGAENENLLTPWELGYRAFLSGILYERKKHEWVSVKERLPEPYKYVVCLTAFSQIFIGQYNIENISEGWSNSTGWYEKGYSDSAREGVLFWYSIPPQSFNKCHLCENAATNRVKDALDCQGYVFDCLLCDECRKKIQPILDEKGTAGFVDYLEELEEK